MESSSFSDTDNFTADWQWQMRESVIDPLRLKDHLQISADDIASLTAVTARYPMQVTPYYLSLAMEDPSDPILRQFLPSFQELDSNLGGDPDPLAEKQQSPLPGLVHHYPDRVLVVLTNRCAVHCRHCFRKRCWSRRASDLSRREVAAIALYVKQNSGIREVILSGGDPLLLKDDFLQEILQIFQTIPHVEMVRIGSRLPVVLPQRFTSKFCKLLSSTGPVWLATHFNHPREITAAAATAIHKLLTAGIPVVNQTVLLKGINDDTTVLSELFTGLLRIGVKPYYLFHADPVAGAMHFRTGIEKGLVIMQKLQDTISGLAQPVFAFDLPAGKGKVRVSPMELQTGAKGQIQLLDFYGKVTDYA